MSESLPTVAIIGGTGNLGKGLAYRLAKKGYTVIIGSRRQEKAEDSAKEASARAGRTVNGLENFAAAQAADIVILTVPFAHHRSTLEAIKPAVQGKIFVDATVPLAPPKVMRVQRPENGWAAEQAQELLGEDVRVVSAFQNVAAEKLEGDPGPHESDVLVCGNDPEAREAVITLAKAMDLRAWHAGRIENTAVAEALTSVLIFLNKKYRIPGSGIRITGEPGSAE